MFEKKLPYQKASTTKLGDITLHCFTCRVANKNTYIINVEEYRHNIFAVKFYLKKHRKSENKYKFIENVGSDTARAIFSTCIEIMVHFLKTNPYSSFTYIASASKGESEKNNQRFRIYRYIFEISFPITDFDHKLYEEKSAYLILNRNYIQTQEDPQKLIKDIESLFKVYLT